ncbi:gamete expressed 2 [Striga asiatica]|uniref:Gamete expressed 2 n=1 Tax=Striga asiatica TaxID=4170 RepID=A0A5A7R427_STRAF|nr:gamete expressed 2 [Striga asiatica]
MASQVLLLLSLVTLFFLQPAKQVLWNYDSGKYNSPFNPNITVNDRTGNSSFITGLNFNFNGDSQNWRILFTPIMVGLFHVLIEDVHFRVMDASLQFQVNPGLMYPAAGILSWANGIDEFLAGTKAEILILPKDAFGNNVSLDGQESEFHHNFTLFALTQNGSSANLVDIAHKGWNKQGFISIEFITITAGSLFLHVEVENQTLHDSPFPFSVIPGSLDVQSCTARLNIETKYFQLFSKMEGSINQHDQYGNLVPQLYAFDIEVIEFGTNLSMPVADLMLKDISPGMQSFSFSLHEPGKFTLVISDKEKKTLISNTPYEFTVYVGYCDGVKSIVNGSGLNNSVAGEIAKFSVFLKDAYLYPSPVELESLQVRIIRESDSQVIHSSVHIKETHNDSFYSGRLDHGENNLMQIASAPVVDPMNNFTGNSSHKASDFDVYYIPEKSGYDEIQVFCGNVPLNGGHPFRNKVSPGNVNVSLSGVVKFSEKVPKLIKNEIVVRLVDSFHNPVLQQESKLKLEMASINKSASRVWNFTDNKDGSYSAKYLVHDIGTYEICASYNVERFAPCPLGVNVYHSEYFPKAYNDTIPVWEDESVSFNVLENDYFAGGNASILEYTKPGHGSILQSGAFFRYTPYRGLFGNDTFSYTITDINGNLASASVDLLILCRPPQFVSFPSNLLATEDEVSPTFGGFSGFEITYSDSSENISVSLSSKSGNILLFPSQMQFWQPRLNELSVNRGPQMPNELTLVGFIDAINSALQSIQYLGNANFCGPDIIRVSTMNKNGRNDLDVPIYVQPINDPPLINIPSFIVMDDLSDGVLIFGERGGKFDFIVDPDVENFPGNRSRFSIMLSMEVSAGLLSTSLPAELIESTEVKMKTGYQWQPLLTFVTISRHFWVKAKGIRFRGPIDESNNVLRQLSYHEGQYGAVLTVTVNDLGNYGCYPDCSEMMSESLFVESTVNLVKHKPMSSLAAHTLGSAIVVESFLVFFLGLGLLFYICKCAGVLVHEKKRRKAPEIELSKPQGSNRQTSQNFPGNGKIFSGFCALPLCLRGKKTNSHSEIDLRPIHLSGTEEDNHIMINSPDYNKEKTSKCLILIIQRQPSVLVATTQEHNIISELLEKSIDVLINLVWPFLVDKVGRSFQNHNILEQGHKLLEPAFVYEVLCSWHVIGQV